MTSQAHPRSLAALLRAMAALETLAAGVGFFTMTSIILIDLICRKLFNSGVFGAPSIAVYAMILSAMAGFGLATANGQHLRPKLLDGLVPKQLSRPAGSVGQALSATILLALTSYAFSLMRETLAFGERDMLLRIVVWPMQGIMVVGFALSGLRHLIYATFPTLAPTEQGGAQ